MSISSTPFESDPLGCYNYIDKKEFFTAVTTDNIPIDINIGNFSDSGDSLVSATITIHCMSIGETTNISGYYTGYIITNITNGTGTIVCSNITPVCTEDPGLDADIGIDTSGSPPSIVVTLQGLTGYNIYWGIDSNLKLIDGLIDPNCPPPNTYIYGTISPDENNDPGDPEGPSTITPPEAPVLPKEATDILPPPVITEDDDSEPAPQPTPSTTPSVTDEPETTLTGF